MVSLYTSLRLLRLKLYEFNHTVDVDCIKTANKYSCSHYQYSDAKTQYFLSQCSRLENQSRLQKNMQHVDKLLRSYKCLNVSWNLGKPLLLFFSNGVIVSLELNNENNTLNKIEIDETLCGRFLPSRIVDVILNENYIYVSYVESKLSIVHINHDSPNLMAKMLGKKKGKLVGFEPKLVNFDLCMQNPKPAERKLSLNKDKDLLIVWWKNSGDDVWPWMPVTYLTDRLNMFVYSVRNGIFDLLYPVKVQNELLLAAFSKDYSYKFYCLEERKKDQNFLTQICTYEIQEGHCQLVHSAHLPVNGHLIAFDWSDCEDKLIASDSTGQVLIYDVKSQSCTVNTFHFKGLPHHIAWHPQACIAVIVCQNNKIFCVDVALNLIDFTLCYKRNSLCENVDIGSFFSSKITVQNVLWQKSMFNDTCLLFLDPEMSSFILLKISLGFVSRYNLSYLELISQFLKCNEFERVKSVYSKIDWQFNYKIKFQCLSKALNYLLRKPLNSEVECNLEYMLGSFYLCDNIPSEVVENLETKMYHLTRCFFHRLLSYNRFEKAWSVAVDLDSQDLFLDLYQIAKQNNENILAAVALHKAEQYESHASDTCSESCQSDTCSGSVSSSDVEDDRSFKKWSTFRTMYQDILNQVTDKCKDHEDVNKLTKEIEEAVEKLDMCPSQQTDNKPFRFSQNDQILEHSSTDYLTYHDRRPSNYSLTDISSNSQLEISNFGRHSKYATTPVCQKDFNMMHHKISTGTSHKEGTKSPKLKTNFSMLSCKDNLNENSLMDFSDPASNISLDSAKQKNLCPAEVHHMKSNNMLVECPTFRTVHKKNTDFTFLQDDFSPVNPIFGNSQSPLSSSTPKYDVDNILDMSFPQPPNGQATCQNFHENNSYPKNETLLHPKNALNTNRNNSDIFNCDNVLPSTNTASRMFSAGIITYNTDCLIPKQPQSITVQDSVSRQPLLSSVKSPYGGKARESFEALSSRQNESLKSVAACCSFTDSISSSLIGSFPSIKNSCAKLSLPKVECMTYADNLSINPLSDDQHSASHEVLRPHYKNHTYNSKHNYWNTLSHDRISSFSSSNSQASKTESYSGDILNKSKLLNSVHDKSDKPSPTQYHHTETALKHISSSTESPIHAYSHHLSSVICDMQPSFHACDIECLVTDEESEEMDGTKIKLDHLGVI